MPQPKLTIKQEAFCQAYIETGNASEAYRQSYSTKNMKDASVHRAAKELMDNPKVAPRIDEIRASIAEKAELSIAGPPA